VSDPDVDASANLQAEFIAAVCADDVTHASALIDAGAEVNGRLFPAHAHNQRSKNPHVRYTALERAALNGQADMVGMLLLRRTKTDAHRDQRIIGMAAAKGHLKIVAAILGDSPSSDVIQQAGLTLCCTDWRGHLGEPAVPGGLAAALQYLIERGLDLSPVDPEGRTLLTLAAGLCNTELVAVILAAGYPVNDASTPCCGVLQYPASRGDIETAELLILHGATVDQNEGEALFASANRCAELLASPGPAGRIEGIYTRMVEILLAAGADPSKREYAAVRLAATAGMTDAIVVYLNAGVTLGPIGTLGDGDAEGKTLREIALASGKSSVVACIDAFQQVQALARPVTSAANVRASWRL